LALRRESERLVPQNGLVTSQQIEDAASSSRTAKARHRLDKMRKCDEPLRFYILASFYGPLPVPPSFLITNTVAPLSICELL
jgi:hypothetical protein